MSAGADLFDAVLAASWRGAIVILLVVLLRRLLARRMPGNVWFAAWLAAGLPLFALASFPTGWSPFNILRPPETARFEHAPTLAPRSAAGATAPRETVSAGDLTAATPGWRGRDAAGFVWAAGALLLLTLRGGAAISFAARVRRSSIACDARLARITDDAARALGLRRRIDVVLTPILAAPAVCGLFRTKILFPPALAHQLSDDELRVIVWHELGHWRRRDLWAQLYLAAAETLHWFNPCVWLATRLARTDCEVACDAFVLRRLGPDAAGFYGETLLKLTRLAGAPRPQFAVLGIVETPKSIQRRIHMILAYRSATLARLALGGALLTGIALVGLTRELNAQSAAGVTAGAPSGWHENGNKLDAYEVGVDRQQTRNGRPSAYVKSLETKIAGFGGMMQMCSAENYLGKRLRLSAWMKTENATDGGAHLWLRVDGAGNQPLRFDNMDPRAVKGTTGWKPYSIVLDVPREATALAYGFFIQGTGQAWVSDFAIEEVGDDVPTTNLPTGRSLPRQPVNLTFD